MNISKIKEFFVSTETFNASFFIRSTTQFLIWMSVFVLFLLLFKFSNNTDLWAFGLLGTIFFGLNSIFILESIVVVFHYTYNKISSTIFFFLFSIISIRILFMLMYMEHTFFVDRLNDVFNNVNLK